MKRSDTTVKLDAALVEEVVKELQPGQTLTGFVREAVNYRVQRARLRKAAEAYQAALLRDPDLAAEDAEWEQLALGFAPRTGTKRGASR